MPLLRLRSLPSLAECLDVGFSLLKDVEGKTSVSGVTPFDWVPNIFPLGSAGMPGLNGNHLLSFCVWTLLFVL